MHRTELFDNKSNIYYITNIYETNIYRNCVGSSTYSASNYISGFTHTLKLSSALWMRSLQILKLL